jgi:hypothetical protein
MAPVLKTGIPEKVSGVRIPPSPPDSLGCREIHLRCPENRGKLPRYFNSWPQIGPEKVSRCTPQASFSAVFSGRHMSSPVSTTTSGECNAITNRRYGESDLTSASTLFWQLPRSLFLANQETLIVGRHMGVYQDQSAGITSVFPVIRRSQRPAGHCVFWKPIIQIPSHSCQAARFQKTHLLTFRSYTEKFSSAPASGIRLTICDTPTLRPSWRLVATFGYLARRSATHPSQ